MAIAVTHFTDPGCPWAYSARPALRTLEWRFGDQLEWEIVVIGLTEDAKQYEDRGYTPERMVSSWPVYHERFGMPFGYQVKAGVSATGAKTSTGTPRFSRNATRRLSVSATPSLM